MKKVEVQSSNESADERGLLVAGCAAVLRQGTGLLEMLPDALYAGGKSAEKSSVGAHFRHNLDFVTNFLRGLETGKLDYSARERDLRVETDRRFAVLRFQEAARQIESLSAGDLAKKLLVRSETVAGLWCESSVLREMEFLQSHTIHHYALIQTKLAAGGFPVPPDFGVAPSTLEFWKSRTA